MTRLACVLLVLMAVTVPANAQSEASPFPQWYQDHVAFMTRDGGDWRATNADYSADNPYREYGITWTASAGNSGMTGRLYGVRDDGAVVEFWQFREFWHVGAGEARVMQWGLGGAVGEGMMTRFGDEFSTIRQSYSWPNGAQTEGGHILRTPDADTYIAEQYRVNDATSQWEFEHALTFRRHS